MINAIEKNGVAITRSSGGIGVGFTRPQPDAPVKVEVKYGGRQLKEDWLNPSGPCWRDFYPGIDMLMCGITVKQGTQVLAKLEPPGGDILPFMVLQGEQHHVTEAYCAVPPCLAITDELGATWTLGFKIANKDLSPEGEFAFNVLRDGVDMNEIASRIERRNGKVRILTAQGWKVWGGQFFF